MRPDYRKFSFFRGGLLASLILHALGLFFLLNSLPTPTPAPAEFRFIPLDLSLSEPREKLSQITPESKQIVSKSDRPLNSEPPPNTSRQLSEDDSFTLKESIKRGDPLAGDKARDKAKPEPPSPKALKTESGVKSAPAGVPEKKATKEKISSESKPSTEPPRAPILKLSSEGLADLIEKNDQKTGASPTQQGDQVREQKFRQSEPFRTTSLGGIFAGKQGSSDFLPNVTDGDVTLLNAKADRFAIFVKRVAAQVFATLRSSGWQELHQSEIARIKDFVLIRASLSKSGKLLSTELSERSGSDSFDSLTRQAVMKSAWDQNPPEAAATEDGNIHFIFKAKMWSRAGRDGFNESRWLLLGTGLE